MTRAAIGISSRVDGGPGRNARRPLTQVEPRPNAQKNPRWKKGDVTAR